MDTWNSLCTPAQLYAVISLINVAVMGYNGQMKGVVAQALFAIVWTMVLGWICNKGWTGLSWFLVLLPVVMVVIALVTLGSVALMGAKKSDDVEVVEKDVVVEEEEPAAEQKEYFRRF